VCGVTWPFYPSFDHIKLFVYQTTHTQPSHVGIHTTTRANRSNSMCVDESKLIIQSNGSKYKTIIPHSLLKLPNSMLPQQNHPLAKRPDPANDAPPAPPAPPAPCPDTAFTAAPALAAPHNLALSLSCAVPPLLAGGDGSPPCCC
jgi:hypothetical protein